jgi:hypothetical protein
MERGWKKRPAKLQYGAPEGIICAPNLAYFGKVGTIGGGFTVGGGVLRRRGKEWAFCAVW